VGTPCDVAPRLAGSCQVPPRAPSSRSESVNPAAFISPPWAVNAETTTMSTAMPVFDRLGSPAPRPSRWATSSMPSTRSDATHKPHLLPKVCVPWLAARPRRHVSAAPCRPFGPDASRIGTRPVKGPCAGEVASCSGSRRSGDLSTRRRCAGIPVLGGARRARTLSWFSLAWMTGEGVLGLVAGVAANSISLVGWALGSVIQCVSHR
jgi:hypothetical protein